MITGAKLRLLLGPRTPPVVFGPQPVFSMNVNYSGLENMDASAADVPSVAELSYLAAQGIRNVRLPLSWQKTSSVGSLVGLQHAINVPLDATYLSWVDQALTNAATAGVKLLLDIHMFGNGPGGTVGSSAVPISAFADLHSRLATWCLGGTGGTSHPDAVFGIDLMNEWVNGFDSTIIFNASQAAITAIRAAGFVKRIYVEGTNYTGAWNWVSGQQTDGSIAFNSTGLAALYDPLNNLVFEAHMYFDHDNSGRFGNWAAEVAHDPLTPSDANAPPGTRVSTSIGLTRLQPFVQWCQQHGVRGCIGEMGWATDFPVSPGASFDYADWNAAADAAIGYCQQNNVEVFGFSAGSQAGFGPNYPYLLTPTNGDRSAKVDGTNGVQAPQMTVIQKYTGVQGPAATAYGLFLPYNADGTPNRAMVNGQASAPLHVYYGGNLSSPVTITPIATLADGTTAAPGTFTPASVTLNGTNPVASFTFTPSSSATMQIGATNSAGWTDPALQAVSSVQDKFVGITAFPSNVYGLRRLFTNYTGYAVALQRASDNATKSFPFNNRGDLPRQAIQDWAGSRSIKIVTLYDQGPSGNHITFNSGSAVLTLINGAGYPEITVPSGTRATFNTQAVGQWQQSIVARLNISSAGYGFISQDLPTGPFSFGSNSGYLIEDNTGTYPTQTASIGAVTGAYHSYAGTYFASQGGTTTGGLKGYKDGVQQSSLDTPTHKLGAQYNGVTALGYFVQYAGVSWVGSFTNFAVLEGISLTAGQVAAFASDDATYYSTALPDTLSAVAPTISGTAPTSVVQGSYDQPFSGVTIADTNSGTPTDSVSIALTGGAGTLAGTGLSGTGPYTIAAASTASVTSTLRALTWTPSGSGGSTTTFALTVTSSAGTSATDSQTVVTVQAYVAETPFAAPSGSWTPVAGAASYKGVNIVGGGGYGSGQGYPASSQYNYAYPFDDEIDYYALKGMGIIRMTITSGRLFPNAYGPADPPNRTDEPAQPYRSWPVGSQTNLLSMKAVLDHAFTKGMRVLIDPHDFGVVYDGRTKAWRNAGTNDPEGVNLLKDQLSRLATLFKNYPNVVFSLNNEPVNAGTAQQWRDAAVQYIAAIRAAGATQMIFISGGGSYDAARGWTGVQDAAWGTFNQPGWTGNNGDPLNNFAFEMHAYLDSNNDGVTNNVQGGSASFGSTIMVDGTNWCRYTNGNTSTPRANPFKAFVGEFGWTTDTVPMAAGSNQLDYLSANYDVWLGWTYFLGGSRLFYGSYFLPAGQPQATVGPGNPGSYVDKPQMAQLTAHL